MIADYALKQIENGNTVNLRDYMEEPKPIFERELTVGNTTGRLTVNQEGVTTLALEPSDGPLTQQVMTFRRIPDLAAFFDLLHAAATQATKAQFANRPESVIYL